MCFARCSRSSGGASAPWQKVPQSHRHITSGRGRKEDLQQRHGCCCPMTLLVMCKFHQSGSVFRRDAPQCKTPWRKDRDCACLRPLLRECSFFTCWRVCFATWSGSSPALKKPSIEVMQRFACTSSCFAIFLVDYALGFVSVLR